MTTICSWCTKVITEDETEDGEVISHSICDDCAPKLLRGEFENVDFPQPGLDRPAQKH